VAYDQCYQTQDNGDAYEYFKKIQKYFKKTHDGLWQKHCGKKNTIYAYEYFKKIQKYNCKAKIMKETIIINNNIMSRNSNNNNIKSNKLKNNKKI